MVDAIQAMTDRACLLLSFWIQLVKNQGWASISVPCVLRLTCKSLLAYSVSWLLDVFKALADPTRQRILDELTERNGQTLFEICTGLAMKYGLASTRQAISQHLDVLEAVGLIKTWRDGRYKFHSINTEPLKRIADRWLT